MSKVAAITFALLASASSLAWAQVTPTGKSGAPAPAAAMPGSAAPAGVVLDQKGVKGATATAPSTAGARKAVPVSANLPHPESRVTAGGVGATAPLPAKGQAAGTGKAQVGTNANSATDGSANKSFFESRSNINPRATSTGPANARTPQPATAVGAVAPDGSGNKSFFESRSNTARTDTAAKSTPEAAPSAGSIFKN